MAHGSKDGVTGTSSMITWSDALNVPVYIFLWYVCSALTLFLNKYILTSLDGDPDVVGYTQLLATTFCGCIQVGGPRLYYRASKLKHNATPSPTLESPNGGGASTRLHAPYETFYRDIFLLGMMRFGTVVLGLISLKSVAVSFTETIKASAPLFTVVMTWMVLGEVSGRYVTLSLLPIMLGLMLTSYTELSFRMVGFAAALLNNVLDCIQNVFSKKLLTHLQAFTPTELQFYSSIAAVSIQVPFWIAIRGFSLMKQSFTRWMMLCLLADGFLFHLQSIAAYYVVSVISPVSFSVSNTVKRALLTLVSIPVFGNRVTVLTMVGTLMVIGGVFVYNVARNHEERLRALKELLNSEQEAV